jgi:hypothetical protein
MRNRLCTFTLFLGLSLLGLAACGGGASAPAVTPAPDAKALVYTDPAGTGWRLTKDTSSTPTRIVLNLTGPTGLMTRGVGFNLQAPAGAKFGAFADGLPIRDAGIYQLHMAGSTDPSEPMAITGGVKPGNILSVGIYQKDRNQPAQDSGTTLCQIAIEFDASAKVAAGAPLTLKILKAKVIPEDIGTKSDDLWTLSQKMRMADISIATGTLAAQ